MKYISFISLILSSLLSVATMQIHPIRAEIFENYMSKTITSCRPLLIETHAFPVHIGGKVSSPKLDRQVWWLGSGATARTFRVQDKRTGEFRIEKTYGAHYEPEYPALNPYQIALQEKLVLNWLKDFSIKNYLRWSTPEIISVSNHGTYFTPTLLTKDVRGTSLDKVLNNLSISAQIRKDLFGRYIFEVNQLYLALKKSNLEGQIDAFVDDLWHISDVAYGLPYLVVEIKNVQGSLLNEQSIQFSISLSNIIVSPDGGMTIIDPI